MEWRDDLNKNSCFYTGWFWEILLFVSSCNLTPISIRRNMGRKYGEKFEKNFSNDAWKEKKNSPTSQKRVAHPLLPTSTFLGDASRGERKKRKKRKRREKEAGGGKKEDTQGGGEDENEREEEEKKRAGRLTASTETFKSEEARGSICNSHVSAKLSGQPVARILTALHTPRCLLGQGKTLRKETLESALEKGVRGKFVREEVALEMFPPFLNIPPPPSCFGIIRKSFPYLRLNVKLLFCLFHGWNLSSFFPFFFLFGKRFMVRD